MIEATIEYLITDKGMVVTETATGIVIGSASTIERKSATNRKIVIVPDHAGNVTGPPIGWFSPSLKLIHIFHVDHSGWSKLLFLMARLPTKRSCPVIGRT